MIRSLLLLKNIYYTVYKIWFLHIVMKVKTTLFDFGPKTRNVKESLLLT